MQRFINAAEGRHKAAVPGGFLVEAKKFYYDTAQVASRGTMLALKTIVPESHIVFGTDYPYRTPAWTAEMLVADEVFDQPGLEAIFHHNAAQLLKPLGSASS